MDNVWDLTLQLNVLCKSAVFSRSQWRSFQSKLACLQRAKLQKKQLSIIHLLPNNYSANIKLISSGLVGISGKNLAILASLIVRVPYDYLEIDGEVLNIGAREFIFQGSIVTRVSHKNEGKSCERYGKMLFKITEKRKYWRLQEMQSPCDITTDYVDIFMR